jgi:hypothetical protein
VVVGLSTTEWTNVVSTAATAIATVALAWVAIRTMRDTRRTIDATEKQGELAARAFAFQLEPNLIPDEGQPRVGQRENIGGPPGQVWVEPIFIGLVNVGNGVARIESVEVSLSPGGPAHRVIKPPVASPGRPASVRADFIVPPSDTSGNSPFQPGGFFNVIAHYTGADDAPRLVQFFWKIVPGSQWELELVQPQRAPG